MSTISSSMTESDIGYAMKDKLNNSSSNKLKSYVCTRKKCTPTLIMKDYLTGDSYNLKT